LIHNSRSLVVYFLEPKQVVKVKESTMMVDTIRETDDSEELVGATALAFGHASLAIIECRVASVAITFVDAICFETTIP
jgi:3-dehydroquinate dehydratase